MGNFIITVFIILSVALVIILYFDNLKKKRKDDDGSFDKSDEDIDEYSIDYLKECILNIFAEQVNARPDKRNLDQDEYHHQRNEIAKLRKAQKLAKKGHADSRNDLKVRIKTILTSNDYDFRFKDADLNKIIPFNNPSRLTEWQMHEILLYVYQRVEGEEGFSKMISRFSLLAKEKGTDGRYYYKVTKAKLRRVFADVFSGRDQRLGKPTLNINDKLEIIAQMIFASGWGFSVIDSLYHQKIDEIDCGVSGIPVGGFDIKIDNSQNKNILYSYQSVWVTYSGTGLNLEYLGFTSEEDFERVCEHIYQYNTSNTLAKRHPSALGTMPDGSRIVVTRPPFSDSWNCYLRKHSVGVDAPKVSKLCLEKNGWIVACLYRTIIKAQCTTVITGPANSGKTHWLKAGIKCVDPVYNIRVLESAFELNLRYMYPDANIASMQETATLDTNAAMAINKKTNAAIMVLGEIATPEQCVQFLDTSSVNSRHGISTYHSSSTDELIDTMALNYTRLGIFRDKNDAVVSVAQVINMDVHLDFTSGSRHFSYINEVYPYTEVIFPSETKEFENASWQDKLAADTIKYQKEIIRPKKYKVNRLCYWSDEGGEPHIVLDHLPSDEFQKRIKSKLPESLQKEINEDLAMLKKAWEETQEIDANTRTDYSEGVAQWISKQLSESD